MNYKKVLINKWYLLLPIGSILFYALRTLFCDFPKPLGLDFNAFYYAGKYIFSHPEWIYTDQIMPGYVYFPGFASIFSLLSIFPYEYALVIYFILLLLFAELSIIYLDQILTIKEVNIKMKIPILLAVAGGHVVTLVFEMVQSKYIAAFLLLLFLKRELQREEKEFDLKFFAGQGIILVILISILPYLFCPALIYLLYNSDGIFTTNQLRKYLLLFAEFFIFNFMFLVQPYLILDYLNRIFNQFITSETILFRRALPIMIFYYINAIISIPWELVSGIIIICFFFLNTVYMIYLKKPIEIKFGLFFLFFLLFSNPFYPYTHYAVLLPVIILLFRKLNIKSLFAVFLIYLSYYIDPFSLFDVGVLQIDLLFLIFPSYPNLIYIILLVLFYVQESDMELFKSLENILNEN